MNKSLYNAIKTINSNKENKKILQKYIENCKSDDQSTSSIIKIKYNDLKQLRDNGKLIPGQQYRIIDYVTRCFAENITSALHPFDIIVTASSENSLFEEARAIQREGDEYFKNSNLSAWKIWYCLDNDKNRFSWIKNMSSTLYIYRIINDKKVEGVAKFIGTTYKYSWDAVSENYNKILFSTDTFIILIGDIVPLDDVVIIYFDKNNISHSLRNGMPEMDGLYIIDKIEEDYPTGVIYRMIDEFNNDMPYDFKNIIFHNDLFMMRLGDYSPAKYNYPEGLLRFNTYTINIGNINNLVAEDCTLLPENYNNKICKTINYFNKQTIMPFSLIIFDRCLNIKIGSSVAGVYMINGNYVRLDIIDNMEIDTNTRIESFFVEDENNTKDHYIINKRYSSNMKALIVKGTRDTSFEYYGLEIS